MEEKKYKLSDVIRTPMVDEIYEDDHHATIQLNSISMSDEDREQLKDNAFNVENDIEAIRKIQEDFINWVLKDPEYGFLLRRFK